MRSSPSSTRSEIAEDVMHDLGVLLRTTEGHGDIANDVVAALRRAFDDVFLAWYNAMHDESVDAVDLEAS